MSVLTTMQLVCVQHLLDDVRYYKQQIPHRLIHVSVFHSSTYIIFIVHIFAYWIKLRKGNAIIIVCVTIGQIQYVLMAHSGRDGCFLCTVHGRWIRVAQPRVVASREQTCIDIVLN